MSFSTDGRCHASLTLMSLPSPTAGKGPQCRVQRARFAAPSGCRLYRAASPAVKPQGRLHPGPSRRNDTVAFMWRASTPRTNAHKRGKRRRSYLGFGFRAARRVPSAFTSRSKASGLTWSHVPASVQPGSDSHSRRFVVLQTESCTSCANSVMFSSESSGLGFLSPCRNCWFFFRQDEDFFFGCFCWGMTHKFASSLCKGAMLI